MQYLLRISEERKFGFRKDENMSTHKNHMAEGSAVGDYIIQSLIGEGCDSTVYKAIHKDTQKVVSIFLKTLVFHCRKHELLP